MREKLVKVSQELEDLQELGLEMSKLIFYANKFYNACVLKNDVKRNLFKLAEAKSHLLSCLNIIKNKVESENNELINEYKAININIQKDLDEYFENFLSSIDANQKQLIKDIQNSDDKIIGGLTVPSSIKNFMEELKDGMENIILYPLMMASRIYSQNNFEDKWKNISRRNIFRFILFRCVLISAKIKGSEKRQKTAISSMSAGANITEIKNIRHGRPIIKSQTVEKEENKEDDIDNFEDLYIPEEEL